MMQRRNFLKGTIGTFVGTQIPWHSEQLPEPTSESAGFVAENLRTLHLPMRQLRRFRGVCVLDSGKYILCPPAKNIEIKKTAYGNTYAVRWTIPDIDITRNLNICRLQLFSDCNNLVVEKNNQTLNMISGYLFKCTFSVSVYY